MELNTPRILLAAPKSGCGKTTVTCGLLELLKQERLRPASAKSGPDYIDPMFHREVIGAAGGNLDLFFFPPDTVRYLLAKQSRNAGFAVLEGAMGFYDGIAGEQDASAYELARETGTPVILIADARGAALSVCAEVQGFQRFRPDAGIAGVFLNRVSPMSVPGLKEKLLRETGLPVVGYLPELPEIALESRHLGLVTAAETERLRQKLDRLAETMRQTVELPLLLSIARTAKRLSCPEPELPAPLEQKVRIGLARDKAFCFYYPDALELLEQLGAELVPFSPLTDPALPDGLDGLYLGGGYPELYLEELEQNGSLRAQIRQSVRTGMPTIAECGGFLYLHRLLTGMDGKQSGRMTEFFPFDAFPTQKLRRFGYVTLTAKHDTLLLKRGESIPAHEFHYYESENPGDSLLAVKPGSGRSWDCLHGSETLWAGFPHLHFWSRPESAARFLNACRSFSDGGKKK